MKPAKNFLFLALLLIVSVALAACSNAGAGGSNGGGGGTGGFGPFTVGGTVTGLAGTGLVLQNNSGDDLTISGNGSFAFKTPIASGGAYAVTVSASPNTPVQTCTVANGSGKASANVTTVLITCSTGTVSIGGQVVGLLGTGLVLQDNAKDDLSVAVSGPFTFQTALPIGTNYVVTVKTQPSSPGQTCTVTNGSGTANANVGNIQITCSTGTISIGGTVTGLAKAGSGVTLLDNGGDSLPVKANGSFTFPTLVAAGSTYTVTIGTQPSGPNQVCTVTNGTGTANANVVNVQIICPAIFHTIGGTVVGLVGTNGGMVLQNNLGDNLTIVGNGTFTFNTPIADGSTYDVSEFVAPTTQAQPCVIWGFQGTATSAITSIVVDCGHNDWTWMDGGSAADQKGTWTPPPNPPPNPPPPPTFSTDSPGGRKYPATWTDLNGNLWLFGGLGLTFSPGFTPPATELNDLWEYQGTQFYTGSYSNKWVNVVAEPQATPPPPVIVEPSPRTGAVTWTDSSNRLWLFGGQVGTTFLNDLWFFNIALRQWTFVGGSFNQNGVYSGTQFPGSRWGATGRIDATGKVWLFGGYGYDALSPTPGLLSDLWNFDPGTQTWTYVAGSQATNQTGVYGTLGTPNGASNFPGGRQTAASWIDASGNFWVFGGFTLDSVGNPDGLNDLWEFNAVTNVWTWQSGSNTVNQLGNYGTQQGTPGGVPGARWSSASWADNSGNLWLFGGQGYDSTGNGSLADLWEYNVAGNTWTWTKGPASVSQAGVYDLLNPPGPVIFPHVVNNPGSRFAPGYFYVFQPGTGSSEFWMFGGQGFDTTGGNGNGLLNDLWRYLPYP